MKTMHNLRLILIVAVAVTIAALLLYALWINRKEKLTVFREPLAKRLKIEPQHQSESIKSERNEQLSRARLSRVCYLDDVNDERIDASRFSGLTACSSPSYEATTPDEEIDPPLNADFRKSACSADRPHTLMLTIHKPDCYTPAHSQVAPRCHSGSKNYYGSVLPSPEFESIEAKESAALKVPEKEIVLVLHVTAQNGKVLGGEQLLKSVGQAGFQFGEMNIFHRYSNTIGGGPVLFSLANMVKPGFFYLEDMASFMTPGISIFMKVPGYSDAHQNFKLMVEASQCIADDFGGFVLDDHRRMITSKTLDEYKKRILRALNVYASSN
ncbi:cell division protein ZipA [secondary endosymbiont of Ctenarytaina eucalypti]|nr:cell division protein ZipA [secondary endosymbiont of Ctenarytaina eucalypti]